MSTARFIDIHVVQTVPPANINRDDAGSPKQAIYGGVRRSRVSSQAWKRAARVYTAERQPVEVRSTRTKRLVELVTPLVAERAAISAEDAARISAAVVRGTVTMDSRKTDETSYLLFFGREQVSRVADLIVQHAVQLLELDDKALMDVGKSVSLLDVLGTGHPLDVALYGRMVADMASLNVDASVQVAHALSTHAVELEFDYYTAVDDEKDKAAGDDAGAAMIGTVEFNSATLYRYATIAVDQLSNNLGDSTAVAPAVTQFIEAFAKSMPTGHQNSFANRTRPALVAVVGREDQPVNLVTAFESPVGAAGGIEEQSLRRLATHFNNDVAQWGDHPAFVVASFATTPGAAENVTAAFGDSVPFDQLLTRVSDALEAVSL